MYWAHTTKQDLIFRKTRGRLCLPYHPVVQAASDVNLRLAFTLKQQNKLDCLKEVVPIPVATHFYLPAVYSAVCVVCHDAQAMFC
jgi:hypothetical protein